jgi:thymidylate synthase
MTHHPEEQYLDLLKRILDKGSLQENRTGTDCLVLFGDQIRFSIKDSFPLLTTKKVFWKGIVEELIWFLKGDTNNNNLKEKGVHIWDGNSNRESLDNRGLTTYKEGDCGPIYSFQWKHFGAKYKDCDAEYGNQGTDQIDYIINEIKKNPNSRRIMMTAWNPADISKMCLPPCHTSVQFHVKDAKYLSCHMYQRSCDTFLGLPFNIASYALLTYMIAAKTGLIPEELIISFGNVHIYTNHIEAVKEQLNRKPHKWCSVELDDPANWEMDTINFDQIHLKNYTSESIIKAPMAI